MQERRRNTMSRKRRLMVFAYLLLLAVACVLLGWSDAKYTSAEAATPCANGSWTQADSPNVTAYNHRLRGIAAASANDAWTVGSYSTNSSGSVMPLIEHWKGNEWAVDSQQYNLPSGSILYG